MEQFSLFKWRFNRFYASPEEHNYRFRVFRDNMRRAKKHQLLNPLAVHGVTPFSDLTPAEFRRTYLGLRHGKVLCGEQATTTAQAFSFRVTPDPVGHAGALAQLEPWKVRGTLLLGN